MKLSIRKYTAKDMITLSFRASPLFSSLSALVRIIGAFLPTLNIFVTASFVNTALAVLNGDAARTAIYRPIAMILVIIAYNVISNTLTNLMDGRWIILLRKRLRPLMLERVAKLEYKHIEDTKTADLISRVAPAFDTQVREMYQRITGLIEMVLFIAGILVTLFMQVWWAALSLIIVTIPLMIIAFRAGQKSYSADKEMTKTDRRVWYLSGVLKNRDAVDERTVYGFTEELNKQYSDQFHFARKFRLKAALSIFVQNKLGGIFCSLTTVFTMLALLKPAVSGVMSYGMFIGLIGGILSLFNRLGWGINWIVQDISKKREYLKDLTEFLALSETPDAACLPKDKINFKKIEFKNVEFTYPGTENKILDGVSFIIEYGKHYSFVGENGAGKTTITKLLTGLYTNYEGEILVDGRELKDFSQGEIKGLSSVVYQDFAKYFLTLYENIAIAMPLKDETEKRKNAENAASLVDLTGAASKLKNGFDTQLGKIHEDGVDLSGGEWQRAAMARGVVSSCPLRILDEPTAALDPVSESLVYKKFEEISQGKTTIFISHRLGSTKLADIIYVLKDGKIAEEGSHSELMAFNALYAEMYNAQAEWYSGNPLAENKNQEVQNV